MRSNRTSAQPEATGSRLGSASGSNGCWGGHMNQAGAETGWREVRLAGDSDVVLPHSHVEATGPVLAGLDVGELSEALGASDMPARCRSASRGQLAAWAQQGLDRLGADAVRERAERTRTLRLGAVCGTNTPGQNAEYSRLWPSAARDRQAVDSAYTLRTRLAAEILGVAETEVSLSGRPAAEVDAAREREWARQWGAEASTVTELEQAEPAGALARLQSWAAGLSPGEALSLAGDAHEHAQGQAEVARAAGNENLAQSAEALAGLMATKISQLQAAAVEPEIEPSA